MIGDLINQINCAIQADYADAKLYGLSEVIRDGDNKRPIYFKGAEGLEVSFDDKYAITGYHIGISADFEPMDLDKLLRVRFRGRFSLWFGTKYDKYDIYQLTMSFMPYFTGVKPVTDGGGLVNKAHLSVTNIIANQPNSDFLPVYKPNSRVRYAEILYISATNVNATCLNPCP